MNSVLERFHKAILNKDASIAVADIKAKNKVSPQAQLDIYIEGYRTRLLQAIRSDYPATIVLLGDAEFNRLASEYIEETPPNSYNLDRYPHAFVEAIRGRTTNILAAEVAMLESAIAQVFMEEESQPLLPSHMQHIMPESFATRMLNPRKASRLMRFSYPVNEWFSAERAGEKPAIPVAGQSYLYVFRHKHAVQRENVMEPAYLLLKELFSGTPIEEAVDKTITAHPQHLAEIVQNMQVWFVGWLAKGFFRIDS